VITTSKEFYEKYYGALVGATITKVELEPDEEFPRDFWLKMTVKTPSDGRYQGEEFAIEVSRDEEGNGPGFLFGLPHPNEA